MTRVVCPGFMRKLTANILIFSEPASIRAGRSINDRAGTIISLYSASTVLFYATLQGFKSIEPRQLDYTFS